ncbi:MAG: alpha/beta hydrolase [Opitutales bacterium]
MTDPAAPTALPIWPGQDLSDRSKPNLVPYPAPADQAGSAPGVIICPGGGYSKQADHEGAPFARLFNDSGLAAFILNYRTLPERHTDPYADACRAVRWVRQHAEDYGVDSRRVALMGFSAGGHLVTTVATRGGRLYQDPRDDLADLEARPDRLIACYPVVSFLEYGHGGSRQNLLADEADDPELRRLYSNHLHVSRDTPETFLFHTGEDEPVPMQNSLLFAKACADAGVRCEVHIYRDGPHGVGMSKPCPAQKTWPGLLVDWLQAWV